MNQIKSFDLGRIGLLIKKEIFYQRRAPWIIILAIFLMLLFFHVLMASESPGPNDLPSNHVIFYILTLILLGTVFTSAAFNELNNKSSAHHYLSIPASSLEKIISKWLVTGILYVVVFNVFYFVFTLVSNILTDALFSISAPVFNPFKGFRELNDFSPWFFCQLYLALHTVYLAGSIYFRKHAYFKTMIAQTFISVIMIILIAAVGSLFLSDMVIDGMSSTRIESDDAFHDMMKSIMPGIGRLILFLVFPLWMLTYSFFKLKETEV